MYCNHVLGEKTEHVLYDGPFPYIWVTAYCQKCHALVSCGTKSFNASKA